ncbi:SLC13 family permease [Desulforhopalus sp. 52FAK]
MEAAIITTDMYIVFFLLGLAVFLFVTDLLRVDLVGLLMMVLLPLSGVISAEDAIAGLSSNAVVSIIAVMIIGAGLNKTGVMNLVAAQIIKIAGRGENRIMVVISVTVAVISSFMQNIGAAALFMPATIRISKQLHFSVSRILMPMGFCAIIGGCLTLVGSSPLIMLNDLMEGWWNNNSATVGDATFTPFGLLTVTPIGLALLITALIYFTLFGNKVLPAEECSLDDDNMDKRLHEIYGSEVGHGYEIEVPQFYPNHTLGELEVRPKYHVTVVGIAKQSGFKKNLSPQKDSHVEAGDSIWVVGSEENVGRLCEEQGWVIKPDYDVFETENYPDESGVIEGVVIPHSNLSQHTMEELQFRRLFHINPLAIVRGDEIIMDAINVTKLQQGDTILMQGQWKQFRLLSEQMDIAFLSEIHDVELKPERTRCAVFFLVLALFLALVVQVKLSIALLAGALGMILTRIIPADRAYEAVDWRTVFLLSGLIPLGTAFETTGTAAYIANTVLDLVGSPSPLMLMFIISILASFFSLVASNVGATVLMIPLAMNMAVSVGSDPMIAALVVAVSASNTFILPTHQVNAMIMRPGGYRTKDYMRAGLGMTFLYTAVLMGCITLFFGV